MDVREDEYIQVSPDCVACIEKWKYKDVKNPSREIKLTSSEHRALAYIISLDGRVAEYDKILDVVGSEASTRNTVNKLISGIKKKIPGVYISRQWGIGYQWNKPEENGTEAAREPEKEPPESEGEKLPSDSFKSKKPIQRVRQIRQILVEKKRMSQNAIYLEKMIDQLMATGSLEDAEKSFGDIKNAINAIVRDLRKAAQVENLDNKQFSDFVGRTLDEFEELIRIADNRLQMRADDSLSDRKRALIDVMRSYIIVRFLEVVIDYDSFLLSQASTQIKKEASKIKEDIKIKEDRLAEAVIDLEDKENEMTNVYGGNTI